MLLIFPNYFSDSIKTSIIGILLLAFSKFSSVLPSLFNTFCWFVYGNDWFWLKKGYKYSCQISEICNHIDSEEFFTVLKMEKLIDKW